MSFPCRSIDSRGGAGFSAECGLPRYHRRWQRLLPVDETALVASGHFGLIGMRERAELIGATYQIDAQPGRGTKDRRVCAARFNLRLDHQPYEPQRKRFLWL